MINSLPRTLPGSSALRLTQRASDAAMSKVEGLDTILVTGGAGFVGSHTIVELLKAGYKVVVVDSCINSHPPEEGHDLPPVLERVQNLTGKTVTFHHLSILDRDALKEVFLKHKVDAVIHFAALKAVGESVKRPLDYYHNNITGTAMLLRVMGEVGVKRLVFSSSSTVYGPAKYFPTDEEHPTGQGVTNPYGRSKFVCEEMMKDLAKAEEGWQLVLLRYFNPVGAHPSGDIGEDPLGIPVNLMPYIAQVAVGRRERINVFGGDWDTPDHTCIRDFMHVMDLAEGHTAALTKFGDPAFRGAKPFNLGRGKGVSVLEMIAAFSRACGKELPYKIVGRRWGDVQQTTSSGKLAEKEFGWKATRTLDDMCADTWRWQSKNPNGYL
ncbi:UDP-glucose 4-epimerase-like isoform X3 [Penaeus chinensis]|uniref:UDP-glucose 4-epimerase-like isoform X3 n=1 Tax=Penaeus chinensis TaxID=139456 RepID=UPI001FB6162E|nr:UDP-glucose 4-epimerase-like isoform X3 [Penaeus chinensis]